jgi:hypothetical protein
MSAVELAGRLARKDVSAREVMAAHLAQIDRLNASVNAIVTLVPERAMAEAAQADEAIVRRGPTGILHGLPVAHKDLQDTAGIRTTRGSPFFRDHVPERDSALVARIRTAGAITVGKTNTPEFGAGSQTFNTLFGATLNPYDRTRTCGGSSGGAAVATACRMLPIADGTDVGGSLRNPPAFCNVVGLRPSPGRVIDIERAQADDERHVDQEHPREDHPPGQRRREASGRRCQQAEAGRQQRAGRDVGPDPRERDERRYQRLDELDEEDVLDAGQQEERRAGMRRHAAQSRDEGVRLTRRARRARRQQHAPARQDHRLPPVGPVAAQKTLSERRCSQCKNQQWCQQRAPGDHRVAPAPLLKSRYTASMNIAVVHGPVSDP